MGFETLCPPTPFFHIIFLNAWEGSLQSLRIQSLYLCACAMYVHTCIPLCKQMIIVMEHVLTNYARYGWKCILEYVSR